MTNRPTTLIEWESQRLQIRQTLWQLLGDLPPLFIPQPTITHNIQREGYRLERLTFENGAGASVYGYLLIPDGMTEPAPAVLYHHFHGGKYHLGKDELFLDRLTDDPIAKTLTGAGYVVLAIDAYLFGERQFQSPAGKNEVGSAAELSLFKHFLWEGCTLWGMMVRDDILALNYLESRPEVDPSRIAATGMSLGASRTTWLAALDERIKVAIPVCQMTRYANFAAQGEYVRHGIYYYVPAILKTGIDMEHIVALTAPRVQAILIGDADRLSPIEGIHKVDEFVQYIYGLYGLVENYNCVIEKGVEHTYTSSMYAIMQATLQRYL